MNVNKKNEKEIIYKDLSYKLSGIFFEVQNTLGKAAKEKQYCDYLALLFKKYKINYKREASIPFQTPEGPITGNRADFTIENKIILEIKAKNGFYPFSKVDYFQIQRYLQALNYKLGFLINFRKYPLAIERKINYRVKITQTPQAH